MGSPGSHHKCQFQRLHPVHGAERQMQTEGLCRRVGAMVSSYGVLNWEGTVTKVESQRTIVPVLYHFRVLIRRHSSTQIHQTDVRASVSFFSLQVLECPLNLVESRDRGDAFQRGSLSPPRTFDPERGLFAHFWSRCKCGLCRVNGLAQLCFLPETPHRERHVPSPHRRPMGRPHQGLPRLRFQPPMKVWLLSGSHLNAIIHAVDRFG